MRKRLVAFFLILVILFSNVVSIQAADLEIEKVYVETEFGKNQVFTPQSEDKLELLSESDENTNEIIDSGNCGESATWELNGDYTLTISGSGKMTDYTTDANGKYEVPWKSYTDSIKKIVVNSGITWIGDGSFFSCFATQEIEIADSVYRIGEKSFYSCRALETVNLPDSISVIEDSAFSGCHKLWFINIPDGISYIDEYAFEYCIALKNIYIPNGRIEKYAFENCSSLTSISLGIGVTNIGEYAFKNCNALESIDVDSGNDTFSLEDGILFDSKKERLIKCPSLNPVGSYTIPNTVTNIDPYAFQSCESLESVEMSDSVISIGYAAFRECTNLKSILLSANIETIPTEFAYNCSNLTSIDIPRNVTTVGYRAFVGCYFESITVPASVTIIRDYAFDCKNTELIYFRGNAPSIVTYSFYDNSHQGNREIYYPENDDTWTDDVKQKIKGDNTWISYKPTLLPVSSCEVKVIGEDTLVYNGNEQKPEVSVKDGNLLMKEGTDYTVEYSNNILPGEASVTITGCGEYEGTIIKNFTIKKGILRATVRSYSGIFDGSPHSFINPIVSSAVSSEYFVYYSTSEELTDENYSSTGLTTKPERIKPGTTQVYYYIVDTNGYCEAITGSTFIAIKPNCSANSYSGIYDGAIHTPVIECSEGATLYYSTDKELIFDNYKDYGTTILPGRTEVGTTTIYYIAVPDQDPAETSVTTGSVQIVIENGSQKINISDCSIEVESNLIYTGSPLEPKVTVQYAGNTLVNGRDYSLQYQNNTEIGNGSVIITGEGNYVGSVTKSFVIKEAEQPSTKLISDCEISLAEANLTYNGESQIPEVTVKDGDITLKKDKDYTVTCDTAVDAGTYSIKITGEADYSGTKMISFEILPTKPVLEFESSEVAKTTEDTPFTNSLDAVTDGTITYSSGNTSVATINSNTGKVTIAGVGTTIIRATSAAGKNYLAGEATYTLTVIEKEVQLSLSLENLSYSFGNTASSFGYPEKYIYPLDVYEMIFGKTTKATFWYDRDLEITGGIWRGNCAGFSGTSALLLDHSSGITVTDFDSSANSIGQLNSRSNSLSHGLDVTGFIEAMQISQHTQLFSNEISKNRIYTSKHLNKQLKNLNGFYQTVRTETEAGRPVILTLYQGGGHAVLAYGVREVSDTESQILLYDSNWPEKERALTLKKDTNGNYMEWSYEIGGSYGTWGTDNKSSSISYVPYSVIKEIWLTKGHLKENENVLSINSGSVAIYTSGDKPVATVTQGELSTTIDDIHVVDYLSLERAESDTLLLSVPVDVYTFQNLDKSVEEFEVSMANTNLGASASTTAESITMAVDDSCNLNAVYIDASEDDEYSITLNSSFSYDEDNVVVTGKGSGETMEVSQTKGNININNCQITSISIDGKEIDKYQIISSAGEGGKITPDGETVVTKGESVSYNIEALNGYVISDVFVDGKSVGAVSKYEFNNVTANHEIKAEFKEKDESITPIKKNPNQITAKDFVLTYSNKVQSFYIKATAKDNARLSYSSNNSSVKVSGDGKVTVVKRFVGKASISIKSSPTDTYAEASKVITVTVNPTGTTIKNLKKNGSGKMTVTWKKNSTVTGYQISYSTSSNFKNEKVVTIKKNKTVKTVLKRLNKKKKYYVRVRTYKVVGGKKYYSVWSKKKGGKV